MGEILGRFGSFTSCIGVLGVIVAGLIWLTFRGGPEE